MLLADDGCAYVGHGESANQGDENLNGGLATDNNRESVGAILQFTR